jgi:pimeloyl-ACP methyl ester carboxylesterase
VAKRGSSKLETSSWSGFKSAVRLPPLPSSVLLPPSSTDGTGHSSHDLMHILRAGERPGISDKLLATIKIPVLIVHGTEDKQVFPLPAAKEWVAKLTGGECCSLSTGEGLN